MTVAVPRLSSAKRDGEVRLSGLIWMSARLYHSTDKRIAIAGHGVGMLRN